MIVSNKVNLHRGLHLNRDNSLADTSTSPTCACSVAARSDCVMFLFFIDGFSQTGS